MRKSGAGFTLIELLVVIALISILALIGFGVYSNLQKSARDTARKAEIDAITQAYEDNYNGSSATYNPLSGSQFVKGSVPTAPPGTSPYTFVDGPDASTPNRSAYYKVCTVLEAGGTYCRSNQQGQTSAIAFVLPTPTPTPAPPPPPPPAQTPVQTGLSGTKSGVADWSAFSMGFRFTPTVNGQITKLWSYTTTGTVRTAKLYTDTGTLITSVSITGNGVWASANITPVNVTAGTFYKVVVFPTSNAFYINPTTPSFPATIGNITITSAGYVNGDLGLINNETTLLRGLVDISFVPS